MTSDQKNYNNLKSFFEEEYRSLRGYVQSRIRDTTDRNAEDIVQDVALKLFSRSAGSTPIDNIAGYVYRAVRNKIVDLMRTKKEVSHPGDDLEERFSTFAGTLVENTQIAYSDELETALKNAIANLKPHYRAIILAVDFEGYSYAEISAETGIPPGTLMSRRHRALSLLLKKLKDKKTII